MFRDYDKTPYVMHENKKIYFSESYTDENIKKLYVSLLIESDFESPHRYVVNFNELQDYALFDVGAAEGILTLDCFVSEISETKLFIKMDIEGAEQSALKGARNILTNHCDVKLSVCTYHKESDALQISLFLEELGYLFTYTKGYLFWGNSLKTAILRAYKK